MKLIWFIALFLLLSGCSHHVQKQNAWDPTVPVKRALTWMPMSEQAGEDWGVSPQLITAIIAVELAGNPTLISSSQAIGLMQIKASTAGKEVFNHLHRSGQPGNNELKDPARNIDIGAAYLSILEHGVLKGIANPQTMQYALIVAYVNGAGALLRIFDSNRQNAIKEINGMSPEEFYQHIERNHPAPQASRYLYKVTLAMNSL